MKKVWYVSLGLLFLLSLPLAAAAEEGANREEVKSKTKEAAALAGKDKQAAIEKIGDKQGPFVWKDTYVFLMDLEGNMLAHPMKPELTEKGSLLGVPDKNKENPKMLFAEFVEVARDQEEGWVSYMWPKPGEEKPSEKVTYIYRVPGTDMFTAAGVYK